MDGVFVTGTDTGIGKTTYCRALLAREPGCTYWKPVQTGWPEDDDTAAVALRDDPVIDHALDSLERGRTTFRYDPFGSNLFFTDALRLHEVLAQVSPRQALELGVKVDVGQRHTNRSTWPLACVTVACVIDQSPSHLCRHQTRSGGFESGSTPPWCRTAAATPRE